MMPTQVTKMALWYLQQGDEFYAEQTADDTLWGIISDEMDLTSMQQQKLLDCRPFFKQLSDELQQCAKAIQKMEATLDRKNAKIEQAIHKLTTIISPRQAALFIQWVTNNQACIHLLNKDKLLFSSS